MARLLRRLRRWLLGDPWPVKSVVYCGRCRRIVHASTALRDPFLGGYVCETCRLADGLFPW